MSTKQPRSRLWARAGCPKEIALEPKVKNELKTEVGRVGKSSKKNGAKAGWLGVGAHVYLRN